MGCSTPGLSVLHNLLEFAQTHVHWISDAIQPSHPLSLHSSLALNLSQHQCLFQWAGSLSQVAKVNDFFSTWANNLLAMQETQEMQVWSLGRDGPLEEEMATHFNILAWRIPGMGEPGRLPSEGSHGVRHDWSNLAAAIINLSDNSKGNQPWIFTARTDAEVPIIWIRDAKSQLTEKDFDPGKDWGQEKKGTTEDEMIGCHHWLNGHEFQQTL